MRTAVVLAGVATLLVGCTSGDGRDLPDARVPLPSTTTTISLPDEPALALTAPWSPGEPIPDRYRCGTDAAAPSLGWSGVPADTVELAAAFLADGAVEHVLVGIDPSATRLDEAAIPPGSFWWPPTDVGARWPGLCDDTADYAFTVYALNQQLEAADDSPATDVIALLALTAIDEATVTGQLGPPNS